MRANTWVEVRGGGSHEGEFGYVMRGRRQYGRPSQRRARCERCEWYRTRAAVVCDRRKDLGVLLDVSAAERILRESPREPTTLSPRQLVHYVKEGDVVLSHVPHVDRTKPGIVGVVRHNGRPRRVLIEGSHRAFDSRAARDHFRVYELTEQETAACIC